MPSFARATFPRRARRGFPDARRGSAVITVLILAAVTAVVASGFIVRSANESKLATRGFYQAAALNLAEAGIEEGLHAANSGSFTSANGWTLVTGTSGDYTKSITSGLSFPQASGAIHVRVDDAHTLAPVITAAGVISFPAQRPLVKQLRVSGTKRHLWTNGMVARETLTFSGNASIDSYDSAVGPHNSATNRSDHATVASASTALDPVVVGSNASIYGYVATAGAAPVVGSGGRIYGATTPSGVLVDTSRIRTDFTANLPDARTPTGAADALGNITSTLTLPRTGDTPAADGRYRYTASSLSISSTTIVSITGPVDLIVTGSVSVAGQASISIGGTSSGNPSLNLYTAGSVSIAGNGMANNTNVPSKVAIWGTGTSATTQQISFTGNASFTGTIYAPNADVNLAGNGGSSGAVIARNITVGGNGQFHYDLQLASADVSVDASFKPTSWSELTQHPNSGSDFARDSRAPFAALFN